MGDRVPSKSVSTAVAPGCSSSAASGPRTSRSSPRAAPSGRRPGLPRPSAAWCRRGRGGPGRQPGEVGAGDDDDVGTGGARHRGTALGGLDGAGRQAEGARPPWWPSRRARHRVDLGRGDLGGGVRRRQGGESLGAEVRGGAPGQVGDVVPLATRTWIAPRRADRGQPWSWWTGSAPWSWASVVVGVDWTGRGARAPGWPRAGARADHDGRHDHAHAAQEARGRRRAPRVAIVAATGAGAGARRVVGRRASLIAVGAGGSAVLSKRPRRGRAGGGAGGGRGAGRARGRPGVDELRQLAVVLGRRDPDAVADADAFSRAGSTTIARSRESGCPGLSMPSRGQACQCTTREARILRSRARPCPGAGDAAGGSVAATPVWRSWKRRRFVIVRSWVRVPPPAPSPAIVALRSERCVANRSSLGPRQTRRGVAARPSVRAMTHARRTRRRAPSAAHALAATGRRSCSLARAIGARGAAGELGRHGLGPLEHGVGPGRPRGPCPTRQRLRARRASAAP